MPQHNSSGPVSGSQSSIWAHTPTPARSRLDRPRDVPRPESVEEVAKWAGSENLRNTELIHAPVFWVFLPLAACGFLVWGIITDPGDGWTGNLFDEQNNGQPWNFWQVWVGVGIWLLIAIGVLLVRLSILRDLRVENMWIYEHGVAHSIHRTSVDYDDGEASWATYTALDHRLSDRQAARIHAAFEQWLAQSGLPPSGATPISSTALFSSEAKGGHFILHLPVSTIAGDTTEHRWILITEPRDGDGEVLMTPVPVPKKLEKIRQKLHRRLHVEGESLDRRVGGRMRFRHNTLDPAELDDVHFAGWPDKKQRRSRRERGE